MIRVSKKELEQFTSERLTAYLLVGRAIDESVVFDEHNWKLLAKQYGPAGIGHSVKSNSSIRTRTTLKTGCLGLGDLIHLLVRPLIRLRPKLAKCKPCQDRRTKWNRFRVCWK